MKETSQQRWHTPGCLAFPFSGTVKKKEEVQLESILKVYILKFEKYEQKIFLCSHVILFYKFTGHDL